MADRLRTKMIVRDGEGRPVMVDDSTVDGEWADGDAEDVDCRCWGRCSTGESWTAQLWTEALTLRRVEVAKFQLGPVGATVGSGEAKDLGGLQLRGWSSVLGKADDDGDHRMTVIAVFEVGSAELREVELRVRILNRHGEEAESRDDSIRDPKGVCTLDVALWAKPRMITHGAEVEVTLRTWTPCGAASTEVFVLERGRL
ncbi:MAG: hypothetical protein KC621_31145 [Myxococcales bacterium]|nr:hypothetical protein [Myxococcales bacterium]